MGVFVSVRFFFFILKKVEERKIKILIFVKDLWMLSLLFVFFFR